MKITIVPRIRKGLRSIVKISIVLLLILEIMKLYGYIKLKANK